MMLKKCAPLIICLTVLFVPSTAISGEGTFIPATITSPADGSVLATDSQTFIWTNTGARYYQLWIGDSPGTHTIGAFPQIPTSSTSINISGLPNDRVLYTRLWSYIGGSWYYNDYTFTAALIPAVIIFPADGSILATGRQTFTWTNTGASHYQLWIGDSPGTHTIGAFPQIPTSSTSINLSGLPINGKKLHARIWSLIDNEWHYVDHAFWGGFQKIIPPDLPGCASDPTLWVPDIGTLIPGVDLVTEIHDPSKGDTLKFQFLSSDFPNSANQQADVAFGSAHSLSAGEWDISMFDRITFYFKDMNEWHVDGSGYSLLYHYFLIKDKTTRYRMWFIDNPYQFNSPRFLPGQWVQVTAILNGDESTYYKEGYTDEGHADEPMDFSRITYFEVGVFGPGVPPHSQISFQVTIPVLTQSGD